MARNFKICNISKNRFFYLPTISFKFFFFDNIIYRQKFGMLTSIISNRGFNITRSREKGIEYFSFPYSLLRSIRRWHCNGSSSKKKQKYYKFQFVLTSITVHDWNCGDRLNYLDITIIKIIIFLFKVSLNNNILGLLLNYFFFKSFYNSLTIETKNHFVIKCTW